LNEDDPAVEALPPPPRDDGAIVVFLVDDQAMIGEAVRRALASEKDISFHYCGSGAQAAAMAEKVQPTVILQDLVMPEVDGLALVARYRGNPATRDIPIVVLSSKEDALVKSEAFAAGVDDYLVKLPDRIELIARVRHHSRGYVARLQRDAAYRALDASQQKLLEMNRALQRLSHVDGLTGLSNRRYLDEYLGMEWKRAARELNEFSVLMIDVDNFKKFNDSQGHLAGDEVLKQVGEAVRQALHRPADLAARFGGEEFVVVLPGTGLAGAQVLGERICRRVEALGIAHGAHGAGKVVTVSIGGASTMPVRGGQSTDLLAAADEALYQAKHEGKNRAVLRELDVAESDQSRDTPADA
jgi:two-component system chemotaxis family response regulator WspR